MRYRRYYVKPRPDGSARVVSTGPYVSFLVIVGMALSPLFAGAMIWQFWLAMLDWHWADGSIFLVIYAFIAGRWATVMPPKAFPVYRVIAVGLVAASPVLILAGGLSR